MDDALLMRGFECLGDLFGDRQGFIERDRPLFDPIRQCRSFDEFKDQGPNTISFLKAVDLRDVGMVERSQNLCFTLKPRQSLWVGRERFGEDLERHLPLELGISRLIDLSHAALADEGGDVVVTEAGADVEGHCPP